MKSANEVALWQRVAGVRPSVCSHCRVVAQRYRGRRWYVLIDRLSGRYLRLDADAYALIGRLDGRRTVAIAAAQAQRATARRLRRPAVLELLARLHCMGLLDGLVDRSAAPRAERAIDVRRRRVMSRIANPLTIRLPLFDPGPLLERLATRARHISLPAFSLVALLMLVSAAMLLVGQAGALRAELRNDFLQPANIVLIGCLFPLMKAVHELAHGLVIHLAGGRVNACGISLLVFVPVPYVDASSSWAFPARRTRMLVSAAGMIAELLIAAAALWLWYLTQPGWLHETARGVFLIGAVSTVLFNGNPLLKFDAYYILQDWLEMPNLGPRSGAWYRYLLKRYLCGVERAVPPLYEPGERRWLLLYGVSAFGYRFALTLAIALFLAAHFLLPGVVLGLWALAGLCVLPVWSALRYLFVSAELAGQRHRAVCACLCPLAVLFALMAWLPLPSHTPARGIVWMPTQGQLFAPAEGIIERVRVAPGQYARAGEVLLELDSARLERDLAVIDAELDQVAMRIAAGTGTAGTDLAVLMHERAALRAERAALEQERDALKLRAGMSGIFTVEDTALLAGRHVEAGSLIGLMVDSARLQVRLVVPEELSGQLATGVRSVGVRLADRPHRLLAGTIQRDTPQADHRLPSPALGAAAGGRIVVTGADASGLQTRDPVVHLYVDLPPGTHSRGIGQRAFVNLEHAPEPLLGRLLRTVRRTLLERLPA